MWHYIILYCDVGIHLGLQDGRLLKYLYAINSEINRKCTTLLICCLRLSKF